MRSRQRQAAALAGAVLVFGMGAWALRAGAQQSPLDRPNLRQDLPAAQRPPVATAQQFPPPRARLGRPRLAANGVGVYVLRGSDLFVLDPKTLKYRALLELPTPDPTDSLPRPISKTAN